MTEDRDEIGGKAGEPKRRVLMRIAAVIALLAAVVSVAGLLKPPRYFAKVIMEVRDENAPPGRAKDSKFIAAQFDLMRGRAILFPVIERLDLGKAFANGAERLSAEQVYPPLLRSLDFREIRNTGLVEIGVYSGDPQLAANVANTVAITYQEKRIRDEEMALMRKYAQLEEDARKQAKLVEELAAELVKVRNHEGVFDPDPESATSSVAAVEGKGNTALYIDAKTRYLQRRKISEKAFFEVTVCRYKPSYVAGGVKILEQAEPPPKPVRFGVRHFW